MDRAAQPGIHEEEFVIMRLAFKKFGDPGPVLIIVHGLYGSSDNWFTVAKAMSDQMEVYVIDQRNHGESPWDELHDYPSMKEDLLEFMNENGIEKATLLGHSMGGKTIMSFAMSYPEMVNGLVVIDIAPVSYLELALSSRLAANHGKMIDAMLELDLSVLDSREEVSRSLARSIGSDRIRMFLLKNLTRNNAGEFAWKINLPVLKKSLPGIMDKIPFEESIRLGGIRGFPVIFIRGEHSDYIQPKDHDIIKKLFPTSEIVSIPNSGHWVHAEQPELLIKNLNYFLR